MAITAHAEYPLLPKIGATLLLRWAEVLLIVALLTTGSLVIHFRKQLAATWLLASWAPSHLRIAVTVLTVVAFFLGFFITLWKKRQLFTYSIAEIAFGLFTIFQIGLRLWPDVRLADFVAIGSGLYVTSRGFGNLWDAFVLETKIKRIKLEVGHVNHVWPN